MGRWPLLNGVRGGVKDTGWERAGWQSGKWPSVRWRSGGVAEVAGSGQVAEVAKWLAGSAAEGWSADVARAEWLDWRKGWLMDGHGRMDKGTDMDTDGWNGGRNGGQMEVLGCEPRSSRWPCSAVAGARHSRSRWRRRSRTGSRGSGPCASPARGDLHGRGLQLSQSMWTRRWRARPRVSLATRWGCDLQVESRRKTLDHRVLGVDGGEDEVAGHGGLHGGGRPLS